MYNLHVKKNGNQSFWTFVLEFFVNYEVWQLCNWTGSNLKSLLLLISKKKAGICFLNVLSVLLSHCSEWLQLQDHLKIN